MALPAEAADSVPPAAIECRDSSAVARGGVTYTCPPCRWVSTICDDDVAIVCRDADGCAVARDAKPSPSAAVADEGAAACASADMAVSALHSSSSS